MRRRRIKTSVAMARTATMAAIVIPTAAPVDMLGALEDAAPVEVEASEVEAPSEGDVSEEDKPPGAEEVPEGVEGGLVVPDDLLVSVAELLVPLVELRVPVGEVLVLMLAEVLELVVVEEVLELEEGEVPEPSLDGITESPLCCHCVRELEGKLKYWKVCEFPMVPSRL
jgi:hypothetical protein